MRAAAPCSMFRNGALSIAVHAARAGALCAWRSDAIASQKHTGRRAEAHRIGNDEEVAGRIKGEAIRYWQLIDHDL